MEILIQNKEQKLIIIYDEGKKVEVKDNNLKSSEIYNIFKDKEFTDIQNYEVKVGNEEDKIQVEMKKILETIKQEILKLEENKN